MSWVLVCLFSSSKKPKPIRMERTKREKRQQQEILGNSEADGKWEIIQAT